jgi:hypothetical protein
VPRTLARIAPAAVAATAAAALALPAPAAAHGLVQRANLPIPEWLFGWAAAVVLVVSFVALATLWPRPRLEEPRWRPLPGGLGRVLGARGVELAAGLAGVALLVVTLVVALAGSSSSDANLAPTFVFITFWVGLAFVSVVLGDVFRSFSPWRALGRALEAGIPGLGRRPYPERLGRWPAALVLLAFGWVELVSGWSEEPRTLGIAIAVYTVLTLVAQAIFGTETWTRRGEGFAVYFDLLARISKVETRDRVVGLRPLLGGLPQLDRAPGTVAVVVVMIATVTFDGLSSGALWRDVGGEIDALTGSEGLTDTLGIAACLALIGGFYALGIRGAQSVGGELGSERLRQVFVHTLVPIAMVYVAAHYLTFLLFEGQALGYLASDPLGRGWDLFGTASGAIDYGVITQNQTWYLQVAFVVAGHVAGLVLAHDRALATYGQPRVAARSQYWMLGIMVGFTTLALWLLAQAGA